MGEWPSKAEADRMVDEAMSALDTERRKLAELGRVWEEQTTVRAKDNSLTMTFDGRGELVDVAFRGEKYRTLAPAQLAATILETVHRGRTEAVARMTEVMGGAPEDGLATGFDPVAMVDELIGPMLKGFDELGAVESKAGTDTEEPKRHG